MYCPYCGATNPDDAAFCMSCRATISAPQGVQPAPAWQAPGPGGPGYYDREPYQPQQQFMMYAAFWPRFGAWLLDLLFAALIASFIVAILVIVTAVAGSWDFNFDESGNIAEDDSDELIALTYGFTFLFYGAIVVYQTVANAKGGGWGKRIVGLRVLRARDGQLPGYGTGALRAVFGLILFMVISFLWILAKLWCIWDGQKQTWHDKIAGTVVVVVNR